MSIYNLSKQDKLIRVRNPRTGDWLLLIVGPFVFLPFVNVAQEAAWGLGLYKQYSTMVIILAILFVAGLIVLILVWLVMLIRAISQRLRRNKALKRRHYLSPLSQTSLAVFKQSAIYSQRPTDDVSCQLVKHSGSYQIYDSHLTYRGRRSKRTIYYGVYQASLAKALPHLVFDSKTARGRQFKRSYLKAQKLAVEANFDQHFDSYTPQGYQIDSLSFITPEVLEVMLQLTVCDIEILGDQLFCYVDGTLTTEGLAWFETKCQELHHHLNNNLGSYRDIRQDSGQVTEFGAQLLDNPGRWLWTSVVSLGVLVLGIFGRNLESILVGGVACFTGFKKYRSTKKHNHQLAARFKVKP